MCSWLFSRWRQQQQQRGGSGGGGGGGGSSSSSSGGGSGSSGGSGGGGSSGGGSSSSGSSSSSSGGGGLDADSGKFFTAATCFHQIQLPAAPFESAATGATDREGARPEELEESA